MHPLLAQEYEVLIQEGTDYEYGDKVRGDGLVVNARLSLMSCISSTGNRAFQDTAFLGADGKFYKLAIKVELVEMTEQDQKNLDNQGLCLHTRENTCAHCLEESDEQA